MVAKRSSQPMQPVKQATPLEKQREAVNTTPGTIKPPNLVPGTREGSPDMKLESERPDSKLLQLALNQTIGSISNINSPPGIVIDDHYLSEEAKDQNTTQVLLAPSSYRASGLKASARR